MKRLTREQLMVEMSACVNELPYKYVMITFRRDDGSIASWYVGADRDDEYPLGLAERWVRKYFRAGQFLAFWNYKDESVSWFRPGCGITLEDAKKAM